MGGRSYRADVKEDKAIVPAPQSSECGPPSFAAQIRLTSSVSTEEIAKWLFPLGWTYPGFYSADYFPLFPWLFVFLVGSWAGYYVADKKLPARFYDRKGVPFFSWLGKKALIIYIIHQPILYGLVMLIKLISQNG